MNCQDFWPSQNIRNWLEKILFERYGVNIRIQPSQTGYLSLMIEGQPACVEISSNYDEFACSDSSLSVANWQLVVEGWEPPIADVLPAPGVASLAKPLIEKKKAGYRIHYNILGLMFWILSRQEEVGRTDLDEHGRFPATASHAYRNDYLDRPIIDEWLIILGQVMIRQWPGVNFKNNLFNIKISHDVDHTSRYAFCRPMQFLRRVAADAVINKNAAMIFRAIWIRLTTRDILKKSDPYNSFDWLMDLSEQYGLKSAFYFMAGLTDPVRDGNYEIGHRTTLHLIRKIHNRGHEIGLHPSYDSYRSPGVLLEEITRLQKVCAQEAINQKEWGGRMHYLRWAQPVTLQAIEHAGLTYDCTLGYADQPGFRCGTCFEYPAINPVTKEMLNLRIRPLVVMAGTVISNNYLGLGCTQEAVRKFHTLRSRCEAVNGCYTLLWHNSELTDPYLREMYSQVLGS